MILFLASLVAALTVAVIAQAITIAHLAERRSTRRPREQRPAPRQDRQPLSPAGPYRKGRAWPGHKRMSLLADTTEIRTGGNHA